MTLLIVALSFYSLFIILILCGLFLYKKPIIKQSSEKKIGISVIVAVRNGEKSLPNLLACLSSQKYQGPLEVIVVDDKSEDNTALIIKKYTETDSRFRFETSKMGSDKLRQKKRALDVLFSSKCQKCSRLDLCP